MTADAIHHRIAAQLPRHPTEPVREARVEREVPQEPDWPGLLRTEPAEEFISAAYKAILRRPVDADGLRHYVVLLGAGAPREAVLRTLAESSEATLRGETVQFPADFGPGSIGIAIRLRAWLTRPRKPAESNIEPRIDLLEKRLAAQGDASLALLSQKLDDYFVQLFADATRVERKVETLARELKGSVQQLTSEGTARERRINKDLRQRFNQLEAAIERHRQAAIEAGLGMQRAMKELEERRPPPLVFRGGKNVLVSEVNGFIVGVPGEEWRTAAYHAFRGTMEPGLFRFLERLLRPEMSFVDVGANIGIYTLLAARQVGPAGHVTSYEPTPRLYEILRDNVRVNGFAEWSCVSLRRAAAMDSVGYARLAVFAEDGGHNTLFSPADHQEYVDVPTVRMDEELAGQRPDVVKIDAEGAEPFILRGMRDTIAANPDIRVIVEFAPKHLLRAGVTPTVFLEQIDALGFGIQEIDDLTGELREFSRVSAGEVISANLLLKKP